MQRNTHIQTLSRLLAAATQRPLTPDEQAEAATMRDGLDLHELQWSDTLNDGKPMAHAEAQAAAAALGEGWRLPILAELLSIVDYTRCDPCVDPQQHPTVKSRWYWTDTPAAWSSASAWYVGFYYGLVYDDRRGNRGFALAVRRAGQ